MNENATPPERPPIQDARRDKPLAGALASREARYTLGNDVILSEDTRLQLDECLARLRHHRRIYVEWGFGAVDPMGRSAVLNFYGPPGTGKTLAAEALAGTLKMPFIQLGIAELESKFMGETAKNIQAAFQAARRDEALIFFDEADTLLGKRLSSVTQGVDNEVNAMRSTLLIELERFEGVAVFATNFARNYDEAFRSRIGYHVHFSLPDQDARRRIWDRMMVPAIPLASERDELLDAVTDLSSGLSGREIRTCMRLALPKALMAAEGAGACAALDVAHVQAAIEQLRQAHREVATPPGEASSAVRDAALTRKLLGIQP